MTTTHELEARKQNGSVTILMALVLVSLLGVAALVIDLGHALVTKVELQNTSDAAVLAANRELARIYEERGSTLDLKTYELTESDKARILTAASNIAGMNTASGKPVSLLASDLVTGTFDPASGEVTPTSTGVRAITITARRDPDANGSLQTVFGEAIGIDSVNVAASAAAGLSPPSKLPAGGSGIPVGISSYWFDSNRCGPGSPIRFFPTGDLDGCASWHTYTDSPSSASQLGTILNGLKSGAYASPETEAGTTYYNFIGGSVASRFAEMKALYNAKKDASGSWTVSIPVYEDASCSNPSGSLRILGFATAHIYHVATSPEKTITANVDCAITELGEGGGTYDYGTLYASPGLIQ